MKKIILYSAALAASSMFVNAAEFPKLDEALPKSMTIPLPLFDIDTDSCYPAAGISRSGEKTRG